MQPEPVKTVEQTLSAYEEMLAQREVLLLHIHDAKQAVIPTEIQIELDNIDHEFAGKLETADQKLEALKKELQVYVKASGKRIDGRDIQVIYQKPSWKIKDLVKLLQLAIKTPAIMECLEQSEPVAKVQVIRGK